MAKKYEKVESDEYGRKPPYSGDELDEDPAHCPQEGFAWRVDGKPGGRKEVILIELQEIG